MLVASRHVGNALIEFSTRRTRLAFMLCALGLLGLVAASAWSQPIEVAARPVAEAGGVPLPRFMLICSGCGEKTVVSRAPCRADHRNGAVKCPRCGEFSAAKYRRGSLCMPAGG